MTDPVEQAASRALLREMGLDDAAIERRKKIVGFVPADVERIASLEDLVTQHTEDYVTTFFGHLSDLDEARTLFASPTIVERARQLKREHLAAMVQGEYGRSTSSNVSSSACSTPGPASTRSCSSVRSTSCSSTSASPP